MADDAADACDDSIISAAAAVNDADDCADATGSEDAPVNDDGGELRSIEIHLPRGFELRSGPRYDADRGCITMSLRPPRRGSTVTLAHVVIVRDAKKSSLVTEIILKLPTMTVSAARTQ